VDCLPLPTGSVIGGQDTGPVITGIFPINDFLENTDELLERKDPIFLLAQDLEDMPPMKYSNMIITLKKTGQKSWSFKFQLQGPVCLLEAAGL
jgi:hypothetical protein